MQVSRWDRLKDHLGVLHGFAKHVPPDLEAHLLLAGPAAVPDDPEGREVLAELIQAWERLPSAVRGRTHRRLTPGMRVALGWLSIGIGRQKLRIAMHNGGTGGYRSFVGWAPASGHGVVVLSANVRSVDRIAARLFLDLAGDGPSSATG